jgi:hypothetical protein
VANAFSRRASNLAVAATTLAMTHPHLPGAKSQKKDSAKKAKRLAQ